MSDAAELEGLKKLREPFPANQIGKLPKGGIMLDFVGHGFLTARLLDVDPLWNWEPVAVDDHGLPLFDEAGGLWIRLTICGMSRIGYGDAGGRHGPNAIKEAIGDALRNAAMRFGAALDLWCKGDLDADVVRPPDRRQRVVESPIIAAKQELWALLKKSGVAPDEAAERFSSTHGEELKSTQDVAAVTEMINHYAEVSGA